ncbi:terpene synthase [Streptomyces sp. NPDC048550]|uniref:terpene synthase family protein n=1 Tax=Streptomyces sp. NPDC048550 TaxID=3155739 RepID=UPI003434414D
MEAGGCPGGHRHSPGLRVRAHRPRRSAAGIALLEAAAVRQLRGARSVLLPAGPRERAPGRRGQRTPAGLGQARGHLPRTARSRPRLQLRPLRDARPPRHHDPDRLLLAAQCMAALFAVDDYYCDDERTGSDTAMLGNRLTLGQTALDPAYLVGGWGYQDQLEQALTSDPVLVGLRSYIDRVAGFGTPAQVGRVRHETVAMFVVMNAEAGWRTAQCTPPVWEYLAARQVNSFLPCMTLIDIIGGYELPASLYAHPPVRRATMLAASASIILNDLYSMAKEAEPGIGDGGLPDVIAAERGCPLPEAIDLSAAYHDELVHNFEAAQKDLCATIPSPHLWRYLAGLHAWLGGSHEWHATTGRYAT